MEVSRLALDQAMDRLNLCYGKNTVYYGGAQSALDSAPARIAFTHIPEMEKEREEIASRSD
jgi:DNA polymerase-4